MDCKQQCIASKHSAQTRVRPKEGKARRRPLFWFQIMWVRLFISLVRKRGWHHHCSMYICSSVASKSICCPPSAFFPLPSLSSSPQLFRSRIWERIYMSRPQKHIFPFFSCCFFLSSLGVLSSCFAHIFVESSHSVMHSVDLGHPSPFLKYISLHIYQILTIIYRCRPGIFFCITFHMSMCVPLSLPAAIFPVHSNWSPVEWASLVSLFF